MIKIISAEHVCSAPSAKFFPQEVLPGFAFLGRSNVGKSSLINALTNRKGLAKTSKQPGRTQLINFFKLHLREEIDEKKSDTMCYLVDFPGYGYAQVSKSQRDTWAEMIDSYFKKYQLQTANFLLHDVRREIREQEQWIVDNIDNLQVLITKVDKVGLTEINKRKKEYKDSGINEIILTCSASGKRRGIVELLKAVYNLSYECN